jgi:hypothetical protein
VLAPLDALRELDLLSCGEQVDLPDVLQEELQRVGRDLARLFRLLLLFLVLAGDDLDVKLLQRVVEVVDLRRLEIELVECDGDLVCTELTVLLTELEERLRVLGLEQRGDAGDLRCDRCLGCAHSVPPSWTGFVAMPQSARAPGRAP